jgi:hypothetical protein
MKPVPRFKLYYCVWLVARSCLMTQVSLLQMNGTQVVTYSKLPKWDAVLFHICITPLLKPLLAKRVAHVPLDVSVYGQNGKCCPTEVQGWALKMKVTPAVGSYIWFEIRMVTICTTRYHFKTSFYPRSVCSVCFSGQRMSLYTIKWLVFIPETLFSVRYVLISDTYR